MYVIYKIKDRPSRASLLLKTFAYEQDKGTSLIDNNLRIICR
jgi:hypothetical protein|uniref:Uncharacterized protein n=1 Tax=Siphoviridae sp. ctHiz26 TaxID=2825423 RepID=A0A8S5Q6L1_9CAUD|nr:MAG TPA: hypothetical protein [Siphoviridae sp. ctHiz26]